MVEKETIIFLTVALLIITSIGGYNSGYKDGLLDKVNICGVNNEN